MEVEGGVGWWVEVVDRVCVGWWWWRVVKDKTYQPAADRIHNWDIPGYHRRLTGGYSQASGNPG